MSDMIYLFATLFGIGATYWVWDLGWKKLCLDKYRERLFVARSRLFRLAATGKLDFDSDVYRSMETLICGMQRYAHRMTFMIYLFSFDYQQKNSREKGRPDVYERMLQKTASAPPEVQAELKAILRDVSDDLATYVTTSSLLFMSAIPVAIAAHHLNRMGTFTKEKVSATLANEAYMAECRKGPRAVAA